MGMKLQMIGTGNAFAKKYYNNNALIQTEQYHLLIDCGITAPAALHQLGIDFNEINSVLITHLHSDHVGGLEEMAFYMHFIHNKKTTLYIPQPLIEPLWENSLKAGMHNGEEGCNLHTYFDVIAMEENQITHINNDLFIRIVRTEHVPNKKSYSLIINDQVFYSADMKFNPDLIQEMIDTYGCSIILHDCQFQRPGTVHATLDELLTLPEDIQEKMYLMHYEDTMEDYIGKTGKMKFLIQHKKYKFS